ncbi:MAG: metallophosphoesterase family protein [Anaerolineae bacterium]|nr:metallophosphoesterase family protein [Anaerolineae bacterium]
MTRIAVLSDIHGNLPALDAVIEDMAQYAPDAVVVAGDLINLGPFSTEVLERVFALGWAVIRGNHEFYLLNHDTPRAPEHWRAYTTPAWLRRTISLPLQRRIAALPDMLTLYYPDAPPLRVVHGYPDTPWDGIYPSTPDVEVLAHYRDVAEETIVCGHIHLTQQREVRQNGRGWQIFNAGSLGVPLNGRPGEAPYLLLDGDTHGWQATFLHARYDLAPLLDALESDAYFAAHGAYAVLYTEEFRTARLRIWPFNQWRTQRYPGVTPTQAMTDEFLALGEGIWDYTHPDFWLNRD